MLDWVKRRVAGPRTSLSVAPPSEPGAHDGTGDYRGLRDYLQDRHADRVVLTFGEIEDLLGVPLPDHARIEEAWWCVADGPSTQSNAWTFTGRTAAVNLLARSVVFERDASLGFGSGR
jgi:hypothetical protein